MRLSIRSLALAGALALVGLAGTASTARANDGDHLPVGAGYGAYPGAGYGAYAPGYAPYGSGYAGYAGGYQQYYGNGGHDLQPHWHRSTTPYGTFSWYGNGGHDLQPHEHVQSPYGGYRGYSPNPFGGVTESIYPSTPYTYMPW